MKANIVVRIMRVVIVLVAVNCFSYAGEKHSELKYYYDNQGVKDLAGSQVVCVSEKDNKYLKPHLKYRFLYDGQNRVTEKEAYRWNKSREKWERSFVLTYSYVECSMVVELAVWNKAEGAYNAYTERAVYEIQSNMYTSYSFYRKSELDGSWQLENSHLVDHPVRIFSVEADIFIAENVE